MPAPRYRLIDGQLLNRLMRCPDKGGTRHTARSLATAAGIGKSKIGYMLHGRQTKVTASQADAIAEAVGVTRNALFLPFTSAFADTDTGRTDERRAAATPRTARSTHELGQHPRPDRTDVGRLPGR